MIFKKGDIVIIKKTNEIKIINEIEKINNILIIYTLDGFSYANSQIIHFSEDPTKFFCHKILSNPNKYLDRKASIEKALKWSKEIDKYDEDLNPPKIENNFFKFILKFIK